MIRHSLIYLSLRGMSAVWAFLGVAIFTRLVSPFDYGVYALIVTAVGIATNVMFGWLRQGYIRYYYEENELSILSIIARIFSGGVLLALVAGLILGFSRVQAAILMALPLFLLQSWYDISLDNIRLKQKPVAYGLYSNLRILVFVFMAVACIKVTNWGWPALILGAYAGYVAVILPFTRQALQAVKTTPYRPEIMKRIVRYGTPITVATTMQLASSGVDRYFLAYYMGNQAAGIYATGFDIAQQSLVMLMSVVNLAVYPLLLKQLHSVPKDMFRKEMRSYYHLLMLFALPCALVFVILPTEICQFLVGESYREGASTIMPFIAVGAFLGGLKAFYYDLTFLLSSKTRLLIVCNTVGLGVSMAGNFFLIPKFGLLGAAWVSIIASLSAMTMSIVLGWRDERIPMIWRDPLKTILVSMTFGLLLLFARDATSVFSVVAVIAIAVLCGSGIAVLLHMRTIRHTIRGVVKNGLRF